MSKKKNRPHGHYCKICGEYKANEKFSGKGHAAHICKACSRLSAAEKAAAMDIKYIQRFMMDTEIWSWRIGVLPLTGKAVCLP